MTAGQCFQRPGIPKISFNCESGSIIKILRAFHGLRASNREDAARPEQQQEQQERSLATCRNPESKDASCSFCEGDCIDESVNEVTITIQYFDNSLRILKSFILKMKWLRNLKIESYSIIYMHLFMLWYRNRVYTLSIASILQMFGDFVCEILYRRLQFMYLCKCYDTHDIYIIYNFI